jgi:hypothetical protein
MSWREDVLVQWLNGVVSDGNSDATQEGKAVLVA